MQRLKSIAQIRSGRIDRVTLNRPDVLNAIDDELPGALADCVARANSDPGVHVIVLSGAGRAFCAGYDLTAYAQTAGANAITQEMPWDPMKDYAFMMRNTELFMSLWRSYRPVICKVHGFAIASGSDIALCADTIVMADDAEIGLYASSIKFRAISRSRDVVASTALSTGTTYCCGAGRCHPGARAFLVSVGLLRQHRLFSGRLRSVGGDGFRLALHPDSQSVQARASATESGPPLPCMPRAR
jgi:hypothetical protein